MRSELCRKGKVNDDGRADLAALRKYIPRDHCDVYDVPKELGRASFELDIRVFEDAIDDKIWTFGTGLDAPDEYEQSRLYWHWSHDGPINVPIPMIPDVEEVGEYYMKQRLIELGAQFCNAK